MHPKNLSISDFDYALPEDRIALHPLPERDASRLLVWQDGQLTDSYYRALPNWLPPGSRLVFNDTRVTQSRLLFHKSPGSVIEIFILEPAEGDCMLADLLSAKGQADCLCLVGGAAKWKEGLVLEKLIQTGSGEIHLQAFNQGREGEGFRIRLSWEPKNHTLAEILENAGQMPIPPYLKRKAEAEDAIRYQTIFAGREGSVAAPTAGLHFTERLFAELAQKGITHDYLTLHVGAATFKPVKASRMEAHPMHGEFAEIDRQLLHHILDARGPLIPVGTTSLRTLESMYWIGKKILSDPLLPHHSLTVSQWEPYETDMQKMPSARHAMEALGMWMDRHAVKKVVVRTQLLIAPGYPIKLADGLITNFHQPRSTLLLLVAAWLGSDWRHMYQHALDNDYRFLSYGDGCLIAPFQTKTDASWRLSPQP